MATIKYNGMELEEVTEPQIFDPTRRCVVWDDDSLSPCEQDVIAIFPDSAKLKMKVIDSNLYRYHHCAILPENLAPRIATNRELAKWLAQGNGEWCNCIGDSSRAAIEWWYDQGHSETKANNVFVRKWDDTEWHEPTVDYMEIETNNQTTAQ